MAQLVEHQSMHRKVAGSLPSQGTFPGCGLDPRLECVWETTNQYFSLIWMFLSSYLSVLLTL
jgi:hypothetical protein